MTRKVKKFTYLYTLTDIFLFLVLLLLLFFFSLSGRIFFFRHKFFFFVFQIKSVRLLFWFWLRTEVFVSLDDLIINVNVLIINGHTLFWQVYNHFYIKFFSGIFQKSKWYTSLEKNCRTYFSSVYIVRVGQKFRCPRIFASLLSNEKFCPNLKFGQSFSL